MQSLKAHGENVFHAFLSASGGDSPSLVFLGLQLHNSNLCLHCLMHSPFLCLGLCAPFGASKAMALSACPEPQAQPSCLKPSSCRCAAHTGGTEQNPAPTPIPLPRTKAPPYPLPLIYKKVLDLWLAQFQELGLKRTGLTLLLIIICIFVGIKIIVACSARICKWSTTIVSKDILQTRVDIFHSKYMVPYVSMKLQKTDLRP